MVGALGGLGKGRKAWKGMGCIDMGLGKEVEAYGWGWAKHGVGMDRPRTEVAQVALEWYSRCWKALEYQVLERLLERCKSEWSWNGTSGTGMVLDWYPKYWNGAAGGWHDTGMVLLWNGNGMVLG